MAPRTAPTLLPDVELLRRMARRDGGAFLEIQRRHATSLYAIAYGILSDGRRAEQVVAAVFETAWYETERAPLVAARPAVWLRALTKTYAKAITVASTTT